VRIDFIKSILITEVRKMKVNITTYIQKSLVIEVNTNLALNITKESGLALHALEKLSLVDWERLGVIDGNE